MSRQDGAGNQTTVASYEECALDYARTTAPKAGADESPALRRFVDALSHRRRVLEIGSGPGWDADWLEAHGASVRRTDATQAFVAFQKDRGRLAEQLDVVNDAVGGPYDGVIAQYVFQHIDRPLLPGVLARLADALAPGGALMFTLREGSRDLVETGESGNTYLIAEWEKSELDRMLGDLGLAELWSTSSGDADGQWLTILARKGA